MTTPTIIDVSGSRNPSADQSLQAAQSLLAAARSNQERDVVRALRFGANPDASDGQKTALHWAAYMGHARVVRTLLKGGASAKTLNARQETALHEVASYISAYPNTPDGVSKAQEVVGRLLRAGADPAQRSQPDPMTRRGAATAAHALAGTPAGHAALALILQAMPDLVHAVDQRGDTPLMIAVLEGREQAVTVLLAAGSDPFAMNPHGVSPLLQAQRTQPAIAGHIQNDRVARERAVLTELAHPDVASMTPSRAKPRL